MYISNKILETIELNIEAGMFCLFAFLVFTAMCLIPAFYCFKRKYPIIALIDLLLCMLIIVMMYKAIMTPEKVGYTSMIQIISLVITILYIIFHLPVLLFFLENIYGKPKDSGNEDSNKTKGEIHEKDN